MKSLEIKRHTQVLEVVEQLRNEMIAKEASIDEHSGTAFAGQPLGTRILPMPDDEAEHGISFMSVWLVVSAKRAFVYLPNDEDRAVLDALCGGVTFTGVKVECLDVAKIVDEVPFKPIYKKLRKAGFSRRLTREIGK